MRKKSSDEPLEPESFETCYTPGGQFRMFRQGAGYALEHYRSIEAETAPQLLEDYYDSLAWGVFPEDYPEDCDC